MNFISILIFSSFLSFGSCTASDHKTETLSANLTANTVSSNSAEVNPEINANTNKVTVVSEENKDVPVTAHTKERKSNDQIEIKPVEAKPATNQLPDHKLFDQLLKSYVSATGVVNYKGLKSQETVLDQYLADLAKATPTSTWSRNASLAYWLNAYNAFTLKLILKNYPVKSIQDINSGKPWDLKFIKLADKSYTLNNIENDIIRPTYKDARIHFALVCAAKSCPPLLNEAFTEANVNELLEQRAKKFINSSANVISPNKVELVKIFDWYKADFGNVISFLNKYSTTKINMTAAISYKEYDWSLNGK